MVSVFGSIRAEGRLDRINQAVRTFEEEEERGGAAGLEGHWRGGNSAEAGDVAVLAALVKSDLRRRFGRGESPAVADYIERFPELRGSDSRILSLIYEEYCLRKEGNEEIGVESFCDRYPDWKDSLASQLQYHQLISQAAGLSSAPPKFPKPGDFFGEFALMSLLGTGGSSRVFLARDTSLGDRVVVLKVAIDRGNEPMILGRLVHPRIVWVNSVSYQGETHLRGLSMPYHPGLPLDEIIKGLDPKAPPRDARFFWDILLADRGENSPDKPVHGPSVGPPNENKSLKRGELNGDGWKGFPVRGSYAEGVAWIGRVLAEALHHAHGKGTFHRDIKPGNVLMTLSRGPQLLDFNLAESPHSAERADDALHGGTLPYMAPEQIRAFLDPGRWGEVGAGADIYSLGLVLRELLTGRLPDMPDEALPRSRALADFLDRRACLDPAVRAQNPSVPHALEAIVARCLAFEPGERYADASALAVDLERFLRLQPLAFARNPSRRERLANLLTRRRRLVEMAIACSIGAATLLQPLPVERLPTFTKIIHDLQKPPTHGDSLPNNREESIAKTAKQKERELFDETIAPLKALAASYPDSPLPELFVSVALDASDRGDHQPAEEWFKRAMAVRDAEAIVVAWGRAHPEFGLGFRLDEFAERCLDHACRIKQAKAAPPLAQSSEDDSGLDELTGQACRLALEIDPRCEKSLYPVAAYEESQGRFDVARDLISRRLDKFQGNDPFGDPSEKSSLLLARSRISLNSVDRLRDQGDSNSRREVQETLHQALTDLDQRDRLPVNRADRRWADHRPLSLFFRMKTTLNLAEIALELDRIDEARSDVDASWKALRTLDDLKIDYENLDKMRSRLEDVTRRLQASTPPSHNPEGVVGRSEAHSVDPGKTFDKAVGGPE